MLVPFLLGFRLARLLGRSMDPGVLSSRRPFKPFQGRQAVSGASASHSQALRNDDQLTNTAGTRHILRRHLWQLLRGWFLKGETTSR